jgi:MerR family mercuric resistance operon transcriptional regulator
MNIGPYIAWFTPVCQEESLDTFVTISAVLRVDPCRFRRLHRDTPGFGPGGVEVGLRLADKRERSCAQVRDLAAAHLSDVQAKIKDLKVMEKVLKDMIARCADGTLPDCPLIEALFREPAGAMDPR